MGALDLRVLRDIPARQLSYRKHKPKISKEAIDWRH
jgi:hypothetical protein